MPRKPKRVTTLGKHQLQNHIFTDAVLEMVLLTLVNHVYAFLYSQNLDFSLYILRFPTFPKAP